MTDVKISWIHETFNKTEEVLNLKYETSYVSPLTSDTFIRDGLYSSLWKWKKEKLDSSAVLHVWNSRFMNDGKDRKFYKLQSKQQKNSSAIKNVLLFLYMDPKSFPVYMLEDALQSLQKSLSGKYGKLKFFCHLSTPAQASPNDRYTMSYFKTLADQLGTIPEYMDNQELIKCYDMSDWLIFEAGTEWVYADNFFVHLCLSRNAHFATDCYPSFEAVEEVIPLSINHEMIVGTAKIEKDKVLKRMQLLDKNMDMKSDNALGIPNDFISLAYENLYLS